MSEPAESKEMAERKAAYEQVCRACELSYSRLMKLHGAEHEAKNLYIDAGRRRLTRKEILKRRDAVVALNAEVADAKVEWCTCEAAKRLYETDWNRVLELVKKAGDGRDERIAEQISFLIYSMSHAVKFDRIAVKRGRMKYQYSDFTHKEGNA